MIVIDAQTFVALVALAVTALAVWLNHRERVAGYRHALYARQIDAHLAVAEAMNVFIARLVVRLPDGDVALTDAMRSTIREATEQSYNDFVHVQTKQEAILPQRTLQATLRVTEAYSAITEPSSQGRALAVKTSAEAERLVRTVLRQVVWAMRDALRTDALSEATLRVVGMSTSERDAIRLAVIDAQVDVYREAARARAGRDSGGA